MKYRREIDGLRAVAVLPVILFHAGFSAFGGGYIGVDVFFVISGYLITGIIVEDLANGRFSIISFYERRARRILPALYFVMACSIPFAWLWMDPFELKEFGQSLVATSLFLSNAFFYLKSDYFDVVSEEKPLLHTWSLAVEEQFYLFFPLLLILFWKRRSWIVWIILGLLAASLASAERGWRIDPGWNFYLPFSRIWELAVGALCALALRRFGRKLNEFLTSIGLFAIVVSVFLFDETTPFPSFYALLPVTGTAFIILFGGSSSWSSRILSTRIFVGIGLISYSAYLWHQPILAFARLWSVEELDTWFLLGAAIASLIFATASYKYIELPTRRRTGPLALSRATIFAASAAGMIVLTGLGLMGQLSKGFPERTDLYSRLAQNYGLNVACNGNGIDQHECWSSAEVDALVWGDSQAMHIAKPISMAESKTGLVQATLSACPPIVGFKGARKNLLTMSCEAFNDSVLSDLMNDPTRIKKIYLSSSFSELIGSNAEENIRLFKDMIMTIRGSGRKVVIVGPSPRATYDVAKCLKKQSRVGASLYSCNFSLSQLVPAYESKIEALRKVAGETGAQFIDLREVVCPEGTCLVYNDGNIVYRDAMHFSIESAAILSAAFL